MPNITIASFEDATFLLEQATDNFAHVVSINNPTHEPPAPLARHGARKLILHFDDIVKPTVIWTAVPSEEDVTRVIEFAEDIASGDKVLVHCAAGISRSAAVALTILASKEERTLAGAKRAYSKMYSSKAELWPNAAIVGHADRLLGFKRNLIEAHLEHRPRDADRFYEEP